MDLIQLKKALKSFKLKDSAFEGYANLYQKLHMEPKKISRWKSLRNPDKKKIIQYSSLPVPDRESLDLALARLAVCKLNGGLGTTMNCRGPKSSIVVREKKTFVDLLVEQIEELNKKHQSDVPLLFMNSFYTNNMTERIVGRAVAGTRILSFCQNAYPRLLADNTGFLDPKKINDDAWYPPGHGDLYSCILDNDYLDNLLQEGRDYLFISNADNLGATIDLKILNYITDEDIPFLMEVTAKTTADSKGGALCQEKDQIKLLEIADVPPEHVVEFCGNEKFNFFNTNNIWINLVRLKQMLKDGSLDLDLIVNRKQVKKKSVLQLETAVGSAFNSFPDAIGMNVPRSRFLPVKKTSDLLLVQSDLFSLNRGTLKRDPLKDRPDLPQINLKDPFDDLKQYQQRIPVPPDISGLDSLELQGEVRFNGKVTLKGNVRLVSNKKSIRIPKGAVLENKTLES
jgi:UTP--glucose-1-phosphate uridylyltransferase